MVVLLGSAENGDRLFAMKSAAFVVVLGSLGCGGSSSTTPPLADAGPAADSSVPVDAGAADATPADATPSDATDESAPPFTGATIHVRGTAVESPSGTPIEGVTICAYAQPGIPCVTTTSTGFDLLVPASSETGVTLAISGRESVLVPIVTSTEDQNGWEIGMTAAADMSVFMSALGLGFPEPSAGILGADVSVPGEMLGLAGLVDTISPRSGSGPLYLTSTGAPDSTATSTSTYSATFFGNLTPGEVVVTFAPGASSGTLTCQLNFGGWSSALPNSARIPIAAGFDTHVGFACTEAAADAGADGG